MLGMSQINKFLVFTGLFFVTGTAISLAESDKPYVETAKKHSWFSFSKPAKDSPEAQLTYAESLMAQEKYKKAGKAFRSLVITWPASVQASKAQWSYAKVLDKRGKSTKAFDAYQELMENYAGLFPDYDKILDRQFEIAKDVMVKRKGKFLFLPGFQSPERAVPMFEKIISNGPRTKHAPEAQYLCGEAYEKSFQYELAVVSYIATLHRYPLSPYAEPAAFGRARALYSLSKDYPNDLQALDEAWAGVMVFLRAYPESKYSKEANSMRINLLDRKAQSVYGVAEYYDRIAKRPKAAQLSYEQFINQYPKSDWTQEARERIVVLAEKPDQPNKETADE
jgi:outer membrane protein assembly factor BamD (BamD/ComL family)